MLPSGGGRRQPRRPPDPARKGAVSASSGIGACLQGADPAAGFGKVRTALRAAGTRRPRPARCRGSASTPRRKPARASAAPAIEPACTPAWAARSRLGSRRRRATPAEAHNAPVQRRVDAAAARAGGRCGSAGAATILPSTRNPLVVGSKIMRAGEVYASAAQGRGCRFSPEWIAWLCPARPRRIRPCPAFEPPPRPWRQMLAAGAVQQPGDEPHRQASGEKSGNSCKCSRAPNCCDRRVSPYARAGLRGQTAQLAHLGVLFEQAGGIHFDDQPPGEGRAGRRASFPAGPGTRVETASPAPRAPRAHVARTASPVPAAAPGYRIRPTGRAHRRRHENGGWHGVCARRVMQRQAGLVMQQPARHVLQGLYRQRELVLFQRGGQRVVPAVFADAGAVGGLAGRRDLVIVGAFRSTSAHGPAGPACRSCRRRARIQPWPAPQQPMLAHRHA